MPDKGRHHDVCVNMLLYKVMPTEMLNKFHALYAQPQVEKQSRAFHEAGHAIACIVLKRKFSYVTIRPQSTRSCSGIMVSKGRWSALTRAIYSNDPIKLRFYSSREITMLFAGSIAEEFYLAQYHDLNFNKYDIDDKGCELAIVHGRGYDEDFDTIEYFGGLVGFSSAEIDKLRINCLQLVYDNIDFLTRVASGLLLHKKLRYFQVRALRPR